MFHPMLTHFFNNNQDRGYWGSIQKAILEFLGFLVSSYALSFLVTILVETPSMNLESSMLPRGKDSKKKRGVIDSATDGKEHNIKFNSGMGMDDASTERSSSVYSDSPDKSPDRRNS